MKYPINNIYPTIQGEGALTGVPMILVRLHGCPVGCPFCDTKETWEIDPALESDNIGDILQADGRHKWMSASEVNHYLKTSLDPIRWVMLTGGEPGLYNLSGLVTALHDGGYKVQVETSGTQPGVLRSGVDWLVVSPKIGMPGGYDLISAVIEAADEIKFVIGRQEDLDRLADLLGSHKTKDGVTVCVQPMSQSKRATQLCLDAALRYGYNLSIQVHKYIGVD